MILIQVNNINFDTVNMLTKWTKHWIFYHLVFWIFTFFSFCWDIREYMAVDPLGYWASVIIKVGLLAILVYANLILLIPHIYSRSQVLYWISILILIVLFVLLYRGSYFITTKDVYEVFIPPAIDQNFNKTFIAIRYLIFSMLFHFLRGWFDQEKKLNQIKLTQISTELKLLRAQVNPHFLFNTLNNLYSLALKKSDKTPDLILRLSDMMEYMLSESVDSKVLLQKDIDNLINYLEIEKIRQGNNAIIEMKIQGDLQGKKIVPLVLMPLVENAIKHGINTLQQNAYLKAELTITGDSLEFIIKNNFSNPASSDSTGIGIKNLISRLDFLYPNVYSLKISELGNEYSAVLKIKQI